MPGSPALSEMITAAARQALTNEAEAYSTLEYILRMRGWPAHLQRTVEDVDSITGNMENNHERN